MIKTCSAPQNDHLIFSFVKVGGEKMTRNRRKMIEKTADTLLLSKHSIQFSAFFLLLSGYTLMIGKVSFAWQVPLNIFLIAIVILVPLRQGPLWQNPMWQIPLWKDPL